MTFAPAAGLERQKGERRSRHGRSERPPTAPVSALRPPQGLGTIAVVVGGPIVPADVTGLCARVRAAAAGTGAEVIACDVGGVVDPDAGAVAALARMHLTARRLGSEVRLVNARPELRDLLVFMGLDDVVSPSKGLAGEARREPEEREQGRGVEKEADPGDAI